jgi:rhamnulokinase
VNRPDRFAAVDLGASNGRVIVGWLDGGRLRTEETSRFANTPVRVPNGAGATLHWDVLALWSGILAGLRAAGRAGGVRSVGIDSWAVDYGLLDADGVLIGNPVHYRDERTAGVPDRVLSELGAAEHYRRTGVQVQPFNTVFQVVTERGGARAAAARRLLLVPDLLGYWLTGAEVAELTNASTTGLLDVTTRGWSGDVVARVGAMGGLPLADLLGPVVEPGAVVDPVRPGLADELSLPGADLVAVGSHDTASAVAAVPMTSPGAAYISSGTWSLVGVELTQPVLSEAGRAANFTNELGVFGTVRYLRNVAGLWLLQESLRTWREAGDAQDLGRLLAAAADVPARSCVVDVDDPRLAPPGDMPARLAALAREAGQRPPAGPAEVTRCILDSLALAYRRAVRRVGELSGVAVDVVHVVGGGSRNALLCQLTADAVGLPVVAGPAEGTALGNLLVQASTAGVVGGGLPGIREVIAASTDLVRYSPAPGGDAAWDRAIRLLQP